MNDSIGFPGPFNFALTVSGNYSETLVFKGRKAMTLWIETESEILCEKYGELKISAKPLDRLKIGDACYLIPDENKMFRIIGWIKYSNNSYGFVLDSGEIVPVHKCFKFKKGNLT